MHGAKAFFGWIFLHIPGKVVVHIYIYMYLHILDFIKRLNSPSFHQLGPYIVPKQANRLRTLLLSSPSSCRDTCPFIPELEWEKKSP